MKKISSKSPAPWPVSGRLGGGATEGGTARVSPFTSYPGTEQPLLHWTPSIAPSGMTLYDGDTGRSFGRPEGERLPLARLARARPGGLELG